VFEEKGNKESKSESTDPKVKFRNALNKKNQTRGIERDPTSGNSKIYGKKELGWAPKIFRRKSGSA